MTIEFKTQRIETANLTHEQRMYVFALLKNLNANETVFALVDALTEYDPNVWRGFIANLEQRVIRKHEARMRAESKTSFFSRLLGR
jgi:hypothetical protein